MLTSKLTIAKQVVHETELVIRLQFFYFFYSINKKSLKIHLTIFFLSLHLMSNKNK